MLLTPTAFKSRVIRMLVCGLLAIVLPVQGTAVGIFSVMGKAHIHQKAKVEPVLEDVRRWRPAPVVKAHASSAWGHFHSGAAPERHHHAGDDSSVVRTGADATDAEEALGANALSVLALIPTVARCAVPRAPCPLTSGPLWAVQTGFTLPLDRPPKRA